LPLLPLLLLPLELLPALAESPSPTRSHCCISAARGDGAVGVAGKAGVTLGTLSLTSPSAPEMRRHGVVPTRHACAASAMQRWVCRAH
jgi:hypothetical protein